jgi:hypothetical protein
MEREFSASPAPDRSARRSELLLTRNMLSILAQEVVDDGTRCRCRILIQNIDGLIRDPDDRDLEKQFRINYADFNRYTGHDQP